MAAGPQTAYGRVVPLATVATFPVKLTWLASVACSGKRTWGVTIDDILSEVSRACARERARGKRVVFTHGAFDIVHSGHIHFLERAASFGDVLVVGLHLDQHIRAYKGDSRPVLSLTERLTVVSALRVVDHVLPCPGADAVSVIRMLTPDVYVKDDRVDVHGSVEARAMEEQEGEVVIVPYTWGVSTSLLVKRLLRIVSE